ncbi:PAS domain S-box protein [Caulobacter vibrioides]|uniref:histidine kinase n=1 Tax=Caulobacter vibrioides (strain NA1000 / CB15N) TaxID=565050 RepID=A0A0H3C466_CAUVN|nr:PAS domain S-box protein [Caulobacter vibrioides]YP_002515996.1 PAS-family sensor histidine kinase [Caulobacter vibrioides NA1000]ACL94088.1 PAS-family sensor histidine kinase [Caulobacter vibrioides NA1000]ATC27432.1 hybrid sensor histidine kinase/response regulator [Caulobacter vibrioides]QXZ52669.1 PAS domain S-box protein [Caulobacter vibrioides]
MTSEHMAGSVPDHPAIHALLSLYRRRLGVEALELIRRGTSQNALLGKGFAVDVGASGSDLCLWASGSDGEAARELLTELASLVVELVADASPFAMLEQAPDDLISHYDLTGRLLRVSPAWSRIIGGSVAEAAGRRTWDFIAPEDHPAVAAYYADLLREGAAPSSRLRMRVRHVAGDIRVLESRPMPIRNAEGVVTGFVDIARDITEQIETERRYQLALAQAHEARERAEASEWRLRLLAESAQDLTVQVDASGKILYASSSADRLGLANLAQEGASFMSLVHPDETERAATFIAGAFESRGDKRPSLDTELRFLSVDGDYRWMEGKGWLERDADGVPVALTSTFRDMTDRHSLEESLIAARVRAEAAVRAKSAFLANMTHELRTPLTSVIGFAEQIQAEPALSPTVRHASDRISAGGRALLSTINDILDFSKLESGGVSIVTAATEVNGLIAETVALLSVQADRKGLSLSYDGSAVLGLCAALDSQHVRQVLLNLIGNAIKFTEQGGVTVTAQRNDDGMLEIAVADTGIGIAEDHLERLFGRFSQVDDTIARRFGGSGLGLAIGRFLAEAMGGEIQVSSTVGRGSTFTLTLPLLSLDAAPESAAAPPVLPEGAPILLIGSAIQSLSAVLADAGARVDEATTAEAALSLSEARGYDCVVFQLDLDLDGHCDLARRMRQAGQNRYAPYLAVVSREAAATPPPQILDGLLAQDASPATAIRSVAALMDDGLPEGVGPA